MMIKACAECCSVNSCTPMNATCCFGNPRVIHKLIDSGKFYEAIYPIKKTVITFFLDHLSDELTSHHVNNTSPKDWASLQSEYKKKHTALAFLESIHKKSLNNDDLQCEINNVSRGILGVIVIRNLLTSKLSK